MTHPTSTPATRTKPPEKQAPTQPQNSRYTTPLGSRPGSPTPDSRGQHQFQAPDHLPPDDMSKADSDAAKIEKGDQDAAASCLISDTEMEQKQEEFFGSNSKERRKPDDRLVLAFREANSRRAGEEKEQDVALGKGGGGGKGK